jgi:hypothetical protein
MTYRRRHRWLRRLALGLAFATFAAPAAARLDEGGSGVVTAGGWTGLVDTETGIPLSAGIPRGDESDVASATELASGGSSVSWDIVITLGIGSVVLALALWLGMGFLRRPKLAGL